MIRCGQSPAGFARITPEVLRWVKATAKLDRPGGKTTIAPSQESISCRVVVVVRNVLTIDDVFSRQCADLALAWTDTD